MNTPMNLSGARALAVGAGLTLALAMGAAPTAAMAEVRWNHRCDGEGRH